MLRPGCADRLWLLALGGVRHPGRRDVVPHGETPAGITLPNEQRTRQFIGAAPPPGTGIHRYFFVVDALDVAHLELPDEATPAILGFNRHFHSLARGILVPTATSDE